MKTLLLILALLMPGSVLAEGVLTPAANPAQPWLYDYRNGIRMQEEFLSGTNANQTLGSHGWTTTGTITAGTSAANRYGVMRFDTGASSGTTSKLTLLATASIDPANFASVLWIAKLNNNDANTNIRIGAGNNLSNDPPADGIYFEKDDADTNWFCVTRASSSQTRVDSGVAVNTSYNKFEFNRVGSAATFKINGASVCGAMTATMPTALMTPGMSINNSAAAAKTFDVDYFEMVITGITR